MATANKSQAASREVEFVMAWNTYSVGQRITPPGTLRQFLIEHGFAKPVAPAKAARRKMMDAGRQLFAGGDIVTK